jgi:hypothetical protein
MALLRGRPWLEVVVSGLGGVVLAWAATVLLPAASTVYSHRGVLFRVVKLVVDLTPLQPETVVAGLAGAVIGLFVLYLLDEANRVLGLLLVAVVWLFAVPELRQLNRVVDAVASQLPAFVTVGAVTAVAVGGVSARIHPSVSYDDRSTIGYIKWANFRLASNTLYVAAVGWTVLVAGQYLLTAEADPPPGTVAGTSLVTLAVATLFFRYESRSSVVGVGVGDHELVPYVVSGLYTVAKEQHDGFSIAGEVDQMTGVQDAQLSEYVGRRAVFGYRPGRLLLKRTVRVETDGATVGNVSRATVERRVGGRGGITSRESVRQLAVRSLPRWLVERLFETGGSVLNKCDTADTVVLAVRYPSEATEPDETFRTLCELYDGLSGSNIVVALTHTREQNADENATGTGMQAQMGAQRLEIADLSCPVVAVDRTDIADENYGGFDDLLDEL